MSYQQSPADVAAAYRLVTKSLGRAFSFEQLLTYIAARRSKPLGVQVVDVELGPGTTGCAIGLLDADVIGVRKDLDGRRFLPVRLHEGSHFLLKHVPKYSAGAETATFEEFMESPSTQHALLRDRATNYDNPVEDATENLARLLLKCINRYNGGIPDVASDIYLF